MNEVLVKLALKNIMYASEILVVMINYLEAIATWYPGFVQELA